MIKMEHAPSKTIESRFISEAEVVLFSLWIDQLNTQSPLPIHNTEQLTSLCNKATLEQKPLILLVMGCHDWRTPPWAIETPEEDTVRIIRRITTETPRAQKTAQGFVELQVAFASFGVNTQTFLTLSNVEALMHNSLENMGRQLVNHDLLENLEQSQQSLLNLIHQKGGEAMPFDHQKVLFQLTGFTDLRELQQVLTGEQCPTVRQLDDSLYQFDLYNLPRFFSDQIDCAGIIWIDIISTTLFHEDSQRLREVAKSVNPHIPIMAPFFNGGNWSAKPVCDTPIPSKTDILSGLLNIASRSLCEENWVARLMGTSDKTLQTCMKNLGIEVLIDNKEDRAWVVNFIFRLAFGEKPIQPRHHEISVTIDGQQRIIDVLTEVTGEKRSHLKNLFREGVVSVAGEVIKDHTLLILEPTTISVGKKKSIHITF